MNLRVWKDQDGIGGLIYWIQAAIIMPEAVSDSGCVRRWSNLRQ